MSAPAQALPLYQAAATRATAVAREILAGFDRHYRLFREASRKR